MTCDRTAVCLRGTGSRLGRYNRLRMDTRQLTDGYQLIDLLAVFVPVGPENTGHTRHHQNISVRLKNPVLHFRRVQTRTTAAELLIAGIFLRTLERIMIVNERHRIFRQTLAAERIRVLFQLAVRTLHDSVVQNALLRKIKSHRVVARRLQMRYDLTHTRPELRYRQIRLSGLVVHTQILTCITARHVTTL